MKHVFEIYSEDGFEIREFDLEEDVNEIANNIKQGINGSWYRIRHHICRNDMQQPCDPWETVAKKGEIPEQDEE